MGASFWLTVKSLPKQSLLKYKNMKTLKNLPKRPNYIEPHPSIVYLGKGKSDFVPDVNSPFYKVTKNFGAWDDDSKCFGACDNTDYGIEFGSPDWNQWAKKIWDIEVDPPEDYIIIGPQVSDLVSRFRGSEYDAGEWYDHFSFIGDSICSYAIHKDDPQVENLRKHLTGYSEEVSEDTEESPYEKYKRACAELKEAKEKGWKIQYLDNYPRRISSKEIITLSNDVVSLYMGGLLINWDDYKIIKEEPAPSFGIEGDGNGPYKPEYRQDHWKFGCAEIPHSLIKTLVDTSVYKIKVNEVTIGKGKFTMDQLKELYKYHQNKTTNPHY